MALITRMGTIGAVITSLIFSFPSQGFPWLPYQLNWMKTLQNQNTLVLWFLISIALVMLRLFQVGVAAPVFPQNPGALGLSCWLERKYGWVILVGIAWILVVYGFPAYLLLAAYVIPGILFFPLRVRSVWKVGGKYSYLLLVPLTIVGIGVFVIVWHHVDFLYVVRMFLPPLRFQHIKMNWHVCFLL
jgi:hypothetical protein